MPLTEKNLEIEAPLEFGMLMLEDDQDDTFFSHNSPYSTVRANDLKRGTGRQSQNQRSSVAELLSLWIKDNLPQDTDAEPNEAPVENDVIEVDTSLQDYELPVKGFSVDSRIVPGFRYKVRCVGEKNYFFDGEARRLESVGMGYGRRLTFQGGQPNTNDCHFWSDSNPSGYAFSIHALNVGDVFTIFNSESQPIGEVTIETVSHPQIEKETVIENDNIVKKVFVRFTNSIRYFNHHCNLLNILNSPEFNVVEGIAELVKQKSKQEAFVRCIKNVNLQRNGLCTFQAET